MASYIVCYDEFEGSSHFIYAGNDLDIAIGVLEWWRKLAVEAEEIRRNLPDFFTMDVEDPAYQQYSDHPAAYRDEDDRWCLMESEGIGKAFECICGRIARSEITP